MVTHQLTRPSTELRTKQEEKIQAATNRDPFTELRRSVHFLTLSKKLFHTSPYYLDAFRVFWKEFLVYLLSRWTNSTNEKKRKKTWITYLKAQSESCLIWVGKRRVLKGKGKIQSQVELTLLKTNSKPELILQVLPVFFASKLTDLMSPLESVVWVSVHSHSIRGHDLKWSVPPWTNSFDFSASS
jgi:hypothetical protein